MNEARTSTSGIPMILYRLIQFPLGEPSLFEQGSCASVEIEKVAGKIDDLCGIAIAPLDVYGLSIFQLIRLAHD